MNDTDLQMQAGVRQVYCPQCGNAMLVAPEHLRVAVGCPHCGEGIEPWRMASVAPGTQPLGGGGRLQYGSRGPGVYSWRNRWLAGALAILLGIFGVHRFYLGHTGIGIWMIVVTIFTAGTVTAIWGLVEGILCFCGAMRDVDGLPLSG